MKLLGIKEAANYLSVSERSIKRMLAADEVPTVQLPGIRRVLFRPEDLDKLIKDSLNVPTFVPKSRPFVALLGTNRRGSRR